MKILFASTLSYMPQNFCGSNFSIDQLCKTLGSHGHEVSVLSALRPGGIFAFIARAEGKIRSQINGCKVSKDRFCGYNVWRAWFPWEAIDYVVKEEQPDVIVVISGQVVRMARAAEFTGKPICMHLTDVEFDLHGGDFALLGSVPCIANSSFTSQIYSRKFDVEPDIVFPLIDSTNYKSISTRENITFINPHPKKGRDIALEIARLCTDIPFAIYKSWILSNEEEECLQNMLVDLPNVKLFEPQANMKEVYGKCKILLAPSIWEETYGRVITEAQFSGIPSIASTRGGLPESVGPGGVLINTDAPIEDWINAVRKLWNDDVYYSEISSAALLYANRQEQNIEYQIQAYVQALMNAAEIHEIIDINQRLIG